MTGCNCTHLRFRPSGQGLRDSFLAGFFPKRLAAHPQRNCYVKTGLRPPCDESGGKHLFSHRLRV